MLLLSSVSISDQVALLIGRKEWVDIINRFVERKDFKPPYIQTEYVDMFCTRYVRLRFLFRKNATLTVRTTRCK